MKTVMLKYATTFWLHFKDQIYYPGRAMAFIALTLVRVGIIFFLYAYAFEYVGRDVNGVNLPIAIWSIAMYFVVFAFLGRYIFQLINQDVISGRIELMINKPYHYLLFRAFSQAGVGAFNGLAVLMSAVLILGLLVGLPAGTFDVTWWLQVTLIFFLSLAMCLVFYALVGMAVFWLDDAESIFWLNDKLVMLLGGAYLPVALFPDIICNAAEYSPFGACMFLTHIFYVDFAEKAWGLIAIQVFWLVLLMLVVQWLFVRAQARLQVSGG